MCIGLEMMPQPEDLVMYVLLCCTIAMGRTVLAYCTELSMCA